MGQRTDASEEGSIEMPDTTFERPEIDRVRSPESGEESVRRRAIQQIEHRQRFRVRTAVAGIGMLILVAIWAITEYHNAGGWPTQGFSQSSGIPNVWNIWIIYPILAWLFLTAAHAWSVYGRKPISESEIKREIERETGTG
jgi:hypothetical protein